MWNSMIKRSIEMPKDPLLRGGTRSVLGLIQISRSSLLRRDIAILSEMVKVDM